MKYESLSILIPSHSIEDLPLDLPESQAESLLNAFSVSWHPLLLDAAGTRPQWERADEPPENHKHRLYIIPTGSQDWVPCGWIENARESGAVVITGATDREAMIEQVLQPLETDKSVDSDLVADFLAFGHCCLQLEVLTRQMRYFNELDERRLEGEMVAAARAAVANDRPAAESHLRSCFEILLEGRERFYPVDCYLADLCLLSPEMADDHWAKLVTSDRTVNFLAPIAGVKEIAEAHPQPWETFIKRWRDQQQELIGGEWQESHNALLPLEPVLNSFHHGLREVEQLCGRRPTVWGRRTYGVGVQVPQVLDKLGYEGALHFVMDDGLYPDEEQGKHRWEGCDGSIIDALSRIPLAGDSASGMLRFPQRMAETMDYDSAALLILARWPKLHTPWLEDFHRIHRYAPVLGRFVTFSDFFRTTDSPGRLARHKAGEYLSPHLVQSVAREEADPISRYVDMWRDHHRTSSVLWMENTASVLSGRTIGPTTNVTIRDLWEQTLAVSEPAVRQTRDSALRGSEGVAVNKLAEVVIRGRGKSSGCFLVNTQSFGRRVAIEWPADLELPARAEAILAGPLSEVERTMVVELPPSGFVWLPCAVNTAPPPRGKRVPLAEENVLRNEFFELQISDVTGGISQLKTYRRGPKRLSQQLAFRFPREQTVVSGEGDEATESRTWYSEMRVAEMNIRSEGPVWGEIESKGQLVHPSTAAVIATYTQTVRVWRALPVIEIDVQLETDRLPEGDPWSNYFASRWAWNDSTAALTCSVQEGAHPVTADRFEAPHFIEVTDGEFRTTIHPHGLPFHRKTGPRMIDTLMITAGESCRRFRFVVSVDEAFPMETSRSVLAPLTPVVVDDGPDQPTSAWFFHLDARNVQITQLLPLWASLQDGGDASAAEGHGTHALPTQPLGVRVRLRETEGRFHAIHLNCFRTPASARQCDFLGKTITDLSIDGDAVVVEVTAHEICDVEISFS